MNLEKIFNKLKKEIEDGNGEKLIKFGCFQTVPIPESFYSTDDSEQPYFFEVKIIFLFEEIKFFSIADSFKILRNCLSTEICSDIEGNHSHGRPYFHTEIYKIDSEGKEVEFTEEDLNKILSRAIVACDEDAKEIIRASLLLDFAKEVILKQRG